MLENMLIIGKFQLIWKTFLNLIEVTASIATARVKLHRKMKTTTASWHNKSITPATTTHTSSLGFWYLGCGGEHTVQNYANKDSSYA